MPSPADRVLCEQCHYPVDAPTGACPECGHPIEASRRAAIERGVPLSEEQVWRIARGAGLVVLLVLLACGVSVARVAIGWMQIPSLAVGSLVVLAAIVVGFGVAMRMLGRPWVIVMGFVAIGVLMLGWSATSSAGPFRAAVGPAIGYAAALVPALFGSMLVTMTPVLRQVLAARPAPGRVTAGSGSVSMAHVPATSASPQVNRDGWALIGLSILGLVLRVTEYPSDRTASGFIFLFILIAIFHVTVVMIRVLLRLRRAVPAAE